MPISISPEERQRRQGNKGRKQFREQRIKTAVELQIQGVPKADTAKMLGVTSKKLGDWNREAKDRGLVEGIRAALMDKLLPKAALVYADVLDSSPDKLEEFAKGHKLKLDAARDVATGLGAFRRESSSQSTSLKGSLDLQGFYELREARQRGLPDISHLALPPSPPLNAIEGETTSEHLGQHLQGDGQPPAEDPRDSQGDGGDQPAPPREGMEGPDDGGGDSGRPPGD